MSRTPSLCVALFSLILSGFAGCWWIVAYSGWFDRDAPVHADRDVSPRAKPEIERLVEIAIVEAPPLEVIEAPAQEALHPIADEMIETEVERFVGEVQMRGVLDALKAGTDADTLSDVAYRSLSVRLRGVTGRCWTSLR
ncbi:MAG: hypothetical protein ACI8Z5_000645 [Lentimonas sp.]|jgi:hypothetical protein